MKVNPSIFKSYDVRGTYPDQLDEESALRIGQAFGAFLAQKQAKKGKVRIVVGRDARLSSPSLSKALIKGILSSGADVIDLGLCTTPLMYFAAGYYKYSGGIMVTASHNPGHYNGLKFVEAGASPVGQVNGLNQVRDWAIDDTKDLTAKKKGKVFKKKVINDYVKFHFKHFKAKDISGFKIGIDTANAVSGIMIDPIFSKAKIKTIHLLKKMDGKFPNHEPDPLKEENLELIKKEVIKKKLDLGLAFDGDGDRVMFVDEKGNWVRADIITALMTNILQSQDKNKTVLYDLRSTNFIKETAQKLGGKAIMSRVGHTFIKIAMKENNVYFAGEVSGHYYWQELFCGEAPFFAVFTILKYLKENKIALSEAVAPFQKYFQSPEMNFKVNDTKEIIKKIEAKYKDGKQNTMDGLRVDYPDWWFLVRASNTEPVLRLGLEAKNKELLDQKIIELKKEIQG